MAKKGFLTANLHSDRKSNPEHGFLHKAIHPSVAYGYEDARELAEVFQGKRAGYNYGRQLNPTVTALQDRITAMEDGIATVAFATGMAAISSTLLSLLRAGDHIVSSAFLFGNTNSLARLRKFALAPIPKMGQRAKICTGDLSERGLRKYALGQNHTIPVCWVRSVCLVCVDGWSRA